MENYVFQTFPLGGVSPSAIAFTPLNFALNYAFLLETLDLWKLLNHALKE